MKKIILPQEEKERNDFLSKKYRSEGYFLYLGAFYFKEDTFKVSYRTKLRANNFEDALKKLKDYSEDINDSDNPDFDFKEIEITLLSLY